jgi:hypothetical protein
MRIKILLWITAVAILVSAGASSAQNNGSRNGRDWTYDDRDYREREREREKAWREYLKERRKAYKEWSKANRKERDQFERWLRERYQDRGDWSRRDRDRWDDYGDYRRDRDWDYDDPYGRWGYGNAPRNGVCFYTDAGFRGEEFCAGIDERRRFVGDHYNDRISSIRLLGRARLVVYEHDDFDGDRRMITRDVVNLAGNFNDKISSFEVR